MTNPFSTPQDSGNSGNPAPQGGSYGAAQYPSQPQQYQQNHQQPQQYQQQAPQHYPQGNMPQHAGYGAPMYTGPQKSKLAAALLAFFLGALGIHNFYLGYTGKAVCQLVLTIFGYLTAIFAIGFLFIFAVGIWAFIEFIMILIGGGKYDRDARGIPLS